MRLRERMWLRSVGVLLGVSVALVACDRARMQHFESEAVQRTAEIGSQLRAAKASAVEKTGQAVGAAKGRLEEVGSDVGEAVQGTLEQAEDFE